MRQTNQIKRERLEEEQQLLIEEQTHRPVNPKMENTKRGLSLDFTKPRHPRGGQLPPSLVTPILNLSTPEIHKMISEDEQLTDLTPNTISSVIPQPSVLPSTPLIPTTVNSNNIINNNSNTNGTNHGNNTSSNNSNLNTPSNNNTNGNQNHNSQNKRSDKQRDVDVEKIEKKRERNRLAAKKCRQRKLETIDELRKTVSDWEQKYQRLEMDFEHYKTIRNKELEDLARENSELKSLLRSRQ